MNPKEKIRYTTNPHNRLVVARTGRESRISRYRRVLDGKFSADSGNTLAYHVKRPHDANVPDQIKLSGGYSLDSNHNLVFTLDKWNNQIYGDKLVLQTKFLDAQANSLACGIATKSADGTQQLYRLELAGVWQADDRNRLTFRAWRERGSPDMLTLQGGWELDRNNQIVYTYTKRQGRRKESLSRQITFKGFWDITEKGRLMYSLERGSNSVFDFRTSLGRPVAAGRRQGLEYELGIGLASQQEKAIEAGLGLRW